jgi:hypothetical protein
MVLHRISLFSAALLCANLSCPCCLAVLRFGFRGSMLTSPMQPHSLCSNYFPPGREGDLPENRDVFDSLARVHFDNSSDFIHLGSGFFGTPPVMCEDK